VDPTARRFGRFTLDVAFDDLDTLAVHEYNLQERGSEAVGLMLFIRWRPIRSTMRLTILFALLVTLASPGPVSAQSGPGSTSAEPFKVGTFEIHGVPQVGIVLGDNLMVDLDVANAALESNPTYPRIPMPADMVE
jgi:hypothetical protein